MSKIKYISKQENYTLSDSRESVIKNPIIEPDDFRISYKNNVLQIPFSGYVINSQDKKVAIPEIKGTLHFTNNHVESTVTIADTEVEVLEAMQNAWQYNADEINWGKPDINRAMNFFEVLSDGLKFKDTPEQQLAKDYVLNNVMIEGRPLKEHFELETVEE